jgi:nicotinamide-nucleotide amidase
MARGVAKRCNADWGVATTGVAGPESQDGHPVGEVFVAVSHQARDVLQVKELSLQGERMAIRRQAAVAALALLGDALGLHSIPAVVDDASET